ncbi:hypothetical protein CRG98_007699 [Punica granatum]|uniref:Retrotransposon gag domain-containing protein n=1 Tax=Punica granatum TaxID=22663 RepID=A0A2I0KTY2_PUNGR|nr:hypothetical protein CRG98_007699 [Punica granatum]
MEETIRALQSSGSHLDAGDDDWSLFPGMRLPPKIKYWDFEEFVIHKFQDSLAGATLDWYMSLKAADIPTWADLLSKFIDQYRYCAETPPTLLEFSTMEMTKSQAFEAYAVKWQARATKHVPSISEAQQIQLFHSTLKGAYYLHLLAHMSSFSNLIDAGKKLDMGVKLSKIESPAEKKEGESTKKATIGTPFAGNRKGRDASVNAAYAPHPMHYQQQLPAQQVYYSTLMASFSSPAPQQCAHNYAPTPPPTQQNRPPTSRTPQPFTPLPAPLSHIYRQLLAGNKIRSIAPIPDFDLTIQDQSWRCEYHQGAPGHTTDNYWKLQEKIQQEIDDKQLTFNAIRPPNVQANPLPDHGSSSGPSINMISVCAIREYETGKKASALFVIEYILAETAVRYSGFDATLAPFVIEVPVREPYRDSKVLWTYEGSVRNLEHQFSVMGVTHSSRVYENPEAVNKGKAPTVALRIEEEAEAFMKIIKGSEYKVVEQMGKSPSHISLLALLLSLEPHREALLRVLTAAQVPKKTTPDRIEETLGSIFSNNISFSDDELSSEGYAHSRALYIVCKCNNFVVGRVMIDNSSALNAHAHSASLSKSSRSRMPSACCSGGRGSIQRAQSPPPCTRSLSSSLRSDSSLSKVRRIMQFIRRQPSPTSVLGDDQNLPFYSFDTISVIRDYGKVSRSRADCMVGKGSTTLSRSKSTRTGGDSVFALPATRLLKLVEASTSTVSQHIMGRSTGASQFRYFPTFFQDRRTSSEVFLTAPPRIQTMHLSICQPYEPSPRRLLQGSTSASRRRMKSSTTEPQSRATRLLHSNPNLRRLDSNPSEELLEEPQPIYFGERLDEDGRMPEIEESLHRLENLQLTSVEPIEEINVGTEEEPHTLKIKTRLDPIQRARMIDFLKEYQKVFAWSYADMPGLDPSIVKHFLPLDTENFPPKWQHLRRQQADSSASRRRSSSR